MGDSTNDDYLIFGDEDGDAYFRIVGEIDYDGQHFVLLKEISDPEAEDFEEEITDTIQVHIFRYTNIDGVEAYTHDIDDETFDKICTALRARNPPSTSPLEN